MSKYNKFIFKRYAFDPTSKTLELYYSFDDSLDFCEKFIFDFEYTDYNQEILDKALFSLFLMAGISYYKAYLPANIEIENNHLNEQLGPFFERTYESGLGEFFYNNKISPNRKIVFPTKESPSSIINSNQNNHNKLVGIGGGKDSLLTLEILKKINPEITTWSLGHKSQLKPLIETMATKHLFVKRQLDNKIIDLNSQDAMNGHIPISAILACTGTIVSILSGTSEAVVSNEKSANEPTLEYLGMKINHQYSKSSVFEKDYQEYLSLSIDNYSSYYSFLRPLGELFIAELFSKIGFMKYKTVFSSCNKAFTQESDHIFWCGQCPKCAFTFLIFTPFIEKTELEKLWHGKNLLLEPSLEKTYLNLLGIDGEKPLDCVGEIRESRLAMEMSKKKYPELNKYIFKLDDDYDYREIGPDLMPEETRKVLLSAINDLT